MDSSSQKSIHNAELFNTLQIIWRNFEEIVQTTATIDSATGGCVVDAEELNAKQHWIKLFLFYFQYVNDDLMKDKSFKYFFSHIPEDIASFFLGKVIHIVSKSHLCTTSTDVNIGENLIFAQVLLKNNNFAQLILKKPSDCNKIIALRVFLTHGLGQHILQFLLRVDSKLITSRRSVCNLCINLFPNCPWGDNTTQLQSYKSMYEFIGDLNFFHKNKFKPTTFFSDKYKLKTNYSQNYHKNADGGDDDGDDVDDDDDDDDDDGNNACNECNNCHNCHNDDNNVGDLNNDNEKISLQIDNFKEDFNTFKSQSKTSDEIAYLIIEIIKKSTANEWEITLNQYSLTVIALNFALDTLIVSNETFGNGNNYENAFIIKAQLLNLLEYSFNNIFKHEDGLSAIEFNCVFNKLSLALDLNTKPDDEMTANDVQILYSILFLVVGILYNITSICGRDPFSCSNFQFFPYTSRLFEDEFIHKCINYLIKLFKHDATQQSDDMKLMIPTILKTLIKTIDNLSQYEQHLYNYHNYVPTDPDDIDEAPLQPPKHTRRNGKLKAQLLHCQHTIARPSLSCCLQGSLLTLLPNLNIDLKEYIIRYLLRVGTCCCHYNLDTIELTLNTLLGISANYQKCAYKFIFQKLLNTLFLRDIFEDNKQHHLNCEQCDARIRSKEFHIGLLQLYRKTYEEIIIKDEPIALNLFLKHLKIICHLLNNDVASGVLAEIVLPIFRNFKIKYMNSKAAAAASTAVVEQRRFWHRRGQSFTQNQTEQSNVTQSNFNSTPASPKTPILERLSNVFTTSTEPKTTNPEQRLNYICMLYECLCIFVSYLSDIRLIKNFFNGENIQHLEDLLFEPELTHGICDLIRIGIENISFLGDNVQEQFALSRRLITIQLNSSDRAAKIFQQLLQRITKTSNAYTNEVKEQFWFDDVVTPIGELQQNGNCEKMKNLKPLEILHITTLQWSLNYELLKTSQIFYNEFAKVYSIVVENDDDNIDDCNGEMNIEENIINKRNNNILKHGDKTIIDILKLNYNALSSFLMLLPQRRKPQQRREAQSSTMPVLAPAPAPAIPSTSTTMRRKPIFASTLFDDKENNCLSSSLENLTNIMHDEYYRQQQSILINDISMKNILQNCNVEIDSINDDNNTYKYKSFLQKYIWQDMEETIIIYNILNQQPFEEYHLNYITINSVKKRPTILNVLDSTLKPIQIPIQSITDILLVDPEMQKKHSNNLTVVGAIEQPSDDSIIGKLFNLFGTLFHVGSGNGGSGSQSESLNDLSTINGKEAKIVRNHDIDFELKCLYQTNSDCKKLLLKLFETTMAICIKGYQNEEEEKMEKHLRKLKAIILSYAKSDWKNHSEQHNTIVQTLQTLLKIAELSNTLNNGEPAGIVHGSQLTTATCDDVILSRVRSFNSSARSIGLNRGHSLKAGGGGALTTPTTPRRPLSGESGDGDYFSTRASVIYADSEMEMSDNGDNDDFYLTADEGYDADGEIAELTDSDADVTTNDLWLSLQPTSRYRTHVMHEGLCRLIVEVLMELSIQCTLNPTGWTDSLAQLANRLYVIREQLGGALFLLQGFAPVLKSSDASLKELQQSILELIMDINSPDIIQKFCDILSAKNPPIDMLIKYINHISINGLKKAQATVELEFPVIIDGKCISTCDRAPTDQIDRIRNFHLHYQVATPFTRAPLFIPITHCRLWNTDGFTVSCWMLMKNASSQRGGSQLLEEDNARSFADVSFKTHLISFGTNECMISVYVNGNMNMTFEITRPNGEIGGQKPPDGTEATTEVNTTAIINGQQVPQGSSQIRNALKQTKQVLLQSFNNMHFFTGNTTHTGRYEAASVELPYFRIVRNKWTNFVFSVHAEPDFINIAFFIDGYDQHIIRLPFQNLRMLIRSHQFQVIAVGDGVTTKLNAPTHSSDTHTLESYPLRLYFTNLMLFNRKIVARDSLYNLTAMGPDYSDLTPCQVEKWKPNYGYVNTTRLNSNNLGNFGEAMKRLRESRLLSYAAQQPDVVIGYDPIIEMDNISYGRPYGLILYGELFQNQVQTFQTATYLTGGLSTLLYLFARVVELSTNSDTQAMALDVLMQVALSESRLYAEFVRNDYMSLIGFVIKTERCTKNVNLLKSIINNICSQSLILLRGDTLYVHEQTVAVLLYPHLISSILHRYSDWHRSGDEQCDVLETLFQCILQLVREKHPQREFNIMQLQRVGLIQELLNLCKVYVIESPNPLYISKQAAIMFVDILSIFASTPPSTSLMDEIMKLLLLLHKPSECCIINDRSKLYFLLTNQLPKIKETTLLPFRRSFRRSNRPGQAVPVKTNNLDQLRQERINRLRKLHARNSIHKRVLNEFEENMDNVADCSKLNKNAVRLLSPMKTAKWRENFKRQLGFKRTTAVFKDGAFLPGIPNRLGVQQRGIQRRLNIVICSLSHQVLVDTKGRKKYHNIGSPISSNSSSNDLNNSTAPSRRNKSLIKADFYGSAGIITLQKGLLELLKNFLYLLPDNSVDEVLTHYVKVEFLLVLANHNSCAVRTAVIRLITALTTRLSQNDLSNLIKSYYPHHLANQLSIHPTDLDMFEACLNWVTDVYSNVDKIMLTKILRIQHRFGLNALLAITTKTTAIPIEFPSKVFKILRTIYLSSTADENLLIEAGLLQCCVKALHNVYAKSEIANAGTATAILDLLSTIGEKALKSIGQMNVIWDILNMLSFYQENQAPFVIAAFRTVQGQIQYNWLNLFFAESNVPWNFNVTVLTDSKISLNETKTRLGLLIDRCTQYFTIFDANYTPSEIEIKLFQILVSYCISKNQQCNNFIAWGLQPSRPIELREFIVDVLWISCRDDFVPPILCDGKMIKALLWLTLLEDLIKPIKNLELLCHHLGINENDSTWNLENELERIETSRSATAAKQRTLLEKTIHKYEQITQNCIESSMITTRRVAELQNAERKLLMSYMKDYDDTFTYTKWLEIIHRMTHEGAPWYCKERYENSWEWDATEGPSRIHNRLRRCHLDMNARFFMENEQNTTSCQTTATETVDALTRHHDYIRPLDYLISSYDQQLNISLNSEILYNFPAKYLPVDGEIVGEIIITDHKLYFLATYRCKYFYVTCDVNTITEIWIKRYQHKEKAFEILLDTNQSLFFTLQNHEDWKIMREVFCDKIVAQPDQNRVEHITKQWRDGLLTNWEYLMTLNQISGRTYNDLMQYPVFPWILSNYDSDQLDLTNALNFRKLEKPIAVQHDENEEHYIKYYDYMNRSATNMGSMIVKPYHYSSHYSNSGTVLHFLVRVPPFTSFFLCYQDNNFDLPDRTFHDLNTTWRLATRDSATDVKELIPEFFCLPEMFENFERFNFGCRQSGERVEDVLLPSWCQRDPRLFILIHRQALECELVRNNLHQWIDLIFGYKQTGEAAVQAVNVFHPSTYADFLESEIDDPIERNAVETMVKTYGQMPLQLFKTPHLASKLLNYCLGTKEIIPQVRGLRWGVYLGSPQLPAPALGNIYKIPSAEQLISFNNTNVVYALASKSCVMQGAEPDVFNVVSWGYDDRIVRIQPLNKPQAKPKNLLHNNWFDEITVCGADPNSNQLWFGHVSGRISVYKCTSKERSLTIKSRQNYVRGLRLSYNSAFRKFTTMKSNSGKNDNDNDYDTLSMTNGMNTTTAGSATINGQTINSGNNADCADLCWHGPSILVRHTDKVTCISISVEFKIAVSASRDGSAVIWDLNDLSYIRTIKRPAEIHHSPISLIAISSTLGDIVTVHSLATQNNTTGNEQMDENEQKVPTSPTQLADECFEVTEENLDDFVNVNINPNGKSILRLHTVNARYVNHILHEDNILAVCYSYIKEGVGVNVIATAFEGGIVRLWSSWNLSAVNLIITGLTDIKSIVYSTHQHLVLLTRDSHIQVWETEGLYGAAPKFPQIAYK